MKNFQRDDLMFSLCGLNCALCLMKIDKYCPGCGGGAGNQGCSIAKCSLEHSKVRYCTHCDTYPCEKYVDIDKYDSFITHRNQLRDAEKVKIMGIDNYLSELTEKEKILRILLENYNDGRRKTFYCLAVNLLETEDVMRAFNQIVKNIKEENLNLKEKADMAAAIFQKAATQNNIVLKLYKKASKNK